jgi:hypothetical protein
MKVDGTVYWTLMTYDADGILVDADSTPTVAVRKNNVSVGDAVTVIKRSATTGIYDCSHNPAGEAVGDTFTYEETVAISAQAYVNSWQVKVTPNVSDIWGEPSAGYTVGGTMGNIMKNRPSIQEIVDGVWDEPQSSHLAAGTFGDNLDVRLSDSLEDNMGYYVWNHLLTNINTAGSVGVRVKDLNDFDPVSDTVANVTLVGTTTTNTDMRGTDNALLAADAPTNFDIMSINNSGQVDATGSGGGGSAPTEAEMYTYFTSAGREDAFKADTTGLSTFDSTTDQVVASNMRGTDGANTVAPDNTSIASILADTNELQLNQGDWLTAVGFATPADVLSSQVIVTSAIDTLNDFNPATDTVAHVTLVDTTTDLTNQAATGPTAQEIVDAWGNQPQGVYTTPDTLGFYLDAQVSTAGSGGTGLYQATVRVQDSSTNALQGARVNVDGTTLTLTTDSSGEVTFNLDSGVYLLEVSPPASYDTPVGQVLTITSGDPSDTTFTLNQTTDPTGCTPPWIG